MSRTVCYIPTSLSGHELEARLMMFLRYHKFTKTSRQGEECYKIGGLLSMLLMSPYLKIIPQDGFLHVEAFYVYRRHKSWRSTELKIGTGFLFDPRHMQEKLLELSKVIGTGPPVYYAPSFAGQPQQHLSSSNPPDASGPSDPWQQSSAGQQDAKGTSPLNRGCLKGCLIGCLVIAALFVCLIGGCILLVLLFPEPEDSIAKKRQVSTLGWKTLREDRYSFEYPADWDVFTKENEQVLACKPLEGATDAAVGNIVCRENSGLYDELTQENSLEKLFAGNFGSFACDTFEKGSARGKRAVFEIGRAHV